jgi:outer membrane protein TolC
VRGGPSNGWGDRRDGWTAGLQAQWDIFDGRATAGRVAQAKSQLMQTKLAVDETTLAIDVEVRRAHSSLTEAWELVDASGKVVEQANEALRLANVRYGAGTATQLDVLTSQVALTEARLNQLVAYFNYNIALAAMRKAVGEADPLLQG